MLPSCSAPPPSSVRDLPGHRAGHACRVHPWSLTHWHLALRFPVARVLGAALIVAGLPILLDSFARFALQGRGTPAPVMPPERLVVTGFYRHVRNPMYVAVTA
jgi:protein-S-isoprenylcysteine O-methyltransferase Ste14